MKRGKSEKVISSPMVSRNDPVLEIFLVLEIMDITRNPFLDMQNELDVIKVFC